MLQRTWPMGFAAPDLESRFKQSWARDSAYMDKYFMAISLIGLAGWFSSIRRIDAALTGEQGSCAAVYIPQIGYTSWCLLRATISALAYSVGFFRAVTALSSWLFFDWHVVHRRRLLGVHLAFESVGLVQFAVTRCFLQWHGMANANMRMLLCDTWMTLLVIQLNPDLGLFARLAVVHVVTGVGLHALLAPNPGMAEYLQCLVMKFVIPVGVIHLCERRARKLFVQTALVGPGRSTASQREQQEPVPTDDISASSSQGPTGQHCKDGLGCSPAAETVTTTAIPAPPVESISTKPLQEQPVHAATSFKAAAAAAGAETTSTEVPAGSESLQEHVPQSAALAGLLADNPVEPCMPAEPAAVEQAYEGDSGIAAALEAVEATEAARREPQAAEQQPPDNNAASSSQPFIPPPVAAIAPVRGLIHPRPSVPVIQGPSLLYESPLLHRTVAVKVLTEVAGSQNLELSRLASTMQTAITGLQGMYSTTLRSNVCVPGCAMYLGGITWEQRDADQLQLAAHQLSHLQPLQAAPAYHAGAWQVQLGSSNSGSRPAACQQQSRPAGRGLLVYQTMSDLETAILDGSLEQHMREVQRSAIWQESYAVASWGSQLRLALHQVHSCRANGSCGTRESMAGLAGTCRSHQADPNSIMRVRVVLSQASEVLLDQQQLLCHRPNTKPASWELQLQLPSSRLDGEQGVNVGVLSLHILPAYGGSPHAQQQDCQPQRDSQCSCHAADAFAHVTVLVVPAAVAAELCHWVQQQQLGQRQLQPLMVDLAAVLEQYSLLTRGLCGSSGCSALEGPNSTTCDTGAQAAARVDQYLSAHSCLGQVLALVKLCRRPLATDSEGVC